jgi:hypothetical protein
MTRPPADSVWAAIRTQGKLGESQEKEPSADFNPRVLA